MSLTYKIASTIVRLIGVKKNVFKEQRRDAWVCKRWKCKNSIWFRKGKGKGYEKELLSFW